MSSQINTSRERLKQAAKRYRQRIEEIGQEPTPSLPIIYKKKFLLSDLIGHTTSQVAGVVLWMQEIIEDKNNEIDNLNKILNEFEIDLEQMEINSNILINEIIMLRKVKQENIHLKDHIKKQEQIIKNLYRRNSHLNNGSNMDKNMSNINMNHNIHDTYTNTSNIERSSNVMLNMDKDMSKLGNNNTSDRLNDSYSSNNNNNSLTTSVTMDNTFNQREEGVHFNSSHVNTLNHTYNTNNTNNSHNHTNNSRDRRSNLHQQRERRERELADKKRRKKKILSRIGAHPVPPRSPLYENRPTREENMSSKQDRYKKLAIQTYLSNAFN